MHVNPEQSCNNVHVLGDWVQIQIKIKAEQKFRHQAD